MRVCVQQERKFLVTTERALWRYDNAFIFTNQSEFDFGITLVLAPWSRVILEKLTGCQLVKKFPAFYGTWRFITAFTSARYLSLSWASSIQAIPPHPTSWRSILILSSHIRLGLESGLFPSGFLTKTHYTPLPHTRYMSRLSHSRFYHPNNIGWGVQIIKLLIYIGLYRAESAR